MPPFGPIAMPDRPGEPRAQMPLPLMGSGSDIAFGDGGYILTNNHVVQEMERVTLTSYDRRTFEAQEVADSGLHAGVHYRVDNDVGMEMCRRGARLVIPAVAAGLETAPPP